MRVELYTKDACDYCTAAKSLLTSKNIPFTEYKLGEDFTREILLSKFPEASTYPVVVIDSFNIGGHDQLKHYLAEESKNNTKLLIETDGSFHGA